MNLLVNDCTYVLSDACSRRSCDLRMGKSLVGVVSPIGIVLLHWIGGRQTISTNPVLKEGVLADPVGFLTEITSYHCSCWLVKYSAILIL